jgi:hypothetical protein
MQTMSSIDTMYRPLSPSLVPPVPLTLSSRNLGAHRQLEWKTKMPQAGEMSPVTICRDEEFEGHNKRP